MTAQALLDFLEKAGVVIVLASDGDAVVSNRSSRQLTDKERELFVSLREEIISILKSRKTSTKVGTDVKTIYGPSGPSTLRSEETFVNSFNGATGHVTAIVGVSSVNGDTGDVTVTSGVSTVNGLTGGVTLSAGSNVTILTSSAGITISSAGGTGSGIDFTGFNDNQILFYDGTGISGNDAMLWADDTNHPHAEMDIEGKLLKAIKADEALAALDPVYITGNVGASDRVTVAKADASDPTKMPAAGIVTGAFSTNDQGYMVVTGLIRSADTSGYTANDTVYVANGGGITSVRPPAAGDSIQNIGRVGRVHANTGTLLVLGAGRVNDVPNQLHARLGISADAGVTFPDGTHQNTAAVGGTAYSAGANLELDAARGTFSLATAITLTGGSTSTPIITLESDDNGTSAAPIIDLIRDPADDGNGANGDYLGQIKFKGQSDSGTERVYAKITGKIGNATNSDEDGVVEHMVQRDGSSQIVFRTTKSGIKLNADGGTPMELEFSDGTSINTAPTNPTLKYMMGFNFDGGGGTIAAGAKTDTIRVMEQNATVTGLTVRSEPALVSTARVLLHKVDKSFINSPGASLEANKTNMHPSGTFYPLSSGDFGATFGVTGSNNSVNAGDIVYVELTGTGLNEKLQIFLEYEV